MSLVEEAWPAVLTTKLSLLTVRLDPDTAKPLVAVAFCREVAPMTVRPELALSSTDEFVEVAATAKRRELEEFLISKRLV